MERQRPTNLGQTPLDQNPNILAHKGLETDPEWLAYYDGQLVAFQNGILIGSEPDLTSLLEKIRPFLKKGDVYYGHVGDMPKNKPTLASANPRSTHR